MVHWAALVRDRLKVLDELLEHLFEDLKLNVTVRGKHILRDGLVGRQHTVEGGGVVTAQHACSLLELSLVDVLTSELGQELVQDLLVLLFSNLEALVPSAVLCE